MRGGSLAVRRGGRVMAMVMVVVVMVTGLLLGDRLGVHERLFVHPIGGAVVLH